MEHVGLLNPRLRQQRFRFSLPRSQRWRTPIGFFLSCKTFSVVFLGRSCFSFSSEFRAQSARGKPSFEKLLSPLVAVFSFRHYSPGVSYRTNFCRFESNSIPNENKRTGKSIISFDRNSATLRCILVTCIFYREKGGGRWFLSVLFIDGYVETFSKLLFARRNGYNVWLVYSSLSKFKIKVPGSTDRSLKVPRQRM